MKIAALLTSYNRKDKTIACLTSLMAQKIVEEIEVSIILTDDDSSDGTAESVKNLFPQSKIIKGNGSLFWAGGMRRSWEYALNKDYDLFLLLNDDTILNTDAISKLIQCNQLAKGKYGLPAICIGNTSDFSSKEISYGGKRLLSKLYLKMETVFSETDTLECDLGNANIMLVPKEVVEKTGILSTHFTHGIADYDYTLKAKRAGFPVLLVAGVLGQCTDDHGKNWQSHQVSLSNRIKYLKSPKGLAYTEYLGFIRTHFPFYLPFAFSKLWLKTLFPFLWDALKKNPK